MRIMVVEDDRRTSDYVRQGLIEAGHIVDVLDDGRMRSPTVAAAVSTSSSSTGCCPGSMVSPS